MLPSWVTSSSWPRPPLPPPPLGEDMVLMCKIDGEMMVMVMICDDGDGGFRWEELGVGSCGNYVQV